MYLSWFSADGMLFGPLSKCPVCSGDLRYSGGVYKCQGYLSEWSKCPYSTREPERCKGKWKIPEGTVNEYLQKVCSLDLLICAMHNAMLRKLFVT